VTAAASALAGSLTIIRVGSFKNVNNVAQTTYRVNLVIFCRRAAESCNRLYPFASPNTPLLLDLLAEADLSL
jgi:hypothetical protein